MESSVSAERLEDGNAERQQDHGLSDENLYRMIPFRLGSEGVADG
jgi:hypothetical protein